ncbi:AraC family transcriptional regulator [Sediminitomix flava]|uniref:AraC-like DNA-binding protein n=1 Tax=Sediminitomix flava TaxID=379075 RepID=A0A315ZGH5_SEDFL|nr:helix-turn-helix transcriptional regulator [Sediminitomix flava]PWJ44611.1 AraC-like DNA-binding protein [Sediminitomix flava]
MKDLIQKYELTDNEAHDVPFLLKSMQEIEARNGYKADKPHRHEYYTILWTQKGKGTHLIDFESYQMAPNFIFFVSPHQVHQVVAEQGMQGYVLTFSQEFIQLNGISEHFISHLKIFRNSNENPPLEIDEEKAQKLQFFIDEMLQLQIHANEFNYAALGAYLKLFLIECNQSCNLTIDNSNTSLVKGKELVQQFKNLLEVHFSKEHKVQFYAEQMFITAKYLNEVLVKYTSTKAKEFIQDRIILEAKRMIHFSDENNKEIAFALGFEDPAHLSKMFKKCTDMSMTEFRNLPTQF